MRRHRAILWAAGLWSAAAVAQSTTPVHLSPISFRVTSGELKCCDPAPGCPRVSREIEALDEEDGKCLRIGLGSPVEMELTFQTSTAPAPFRIFVVSNTSWHDVIALRNWDSGGYDVIPMSEPAADGTSVSGTVPASYVETGTGTIVLKMTSYVDPLGRDDKTVDVVDIVIPPP